MFQPFPTGTQRLTLTTKTGLNSLASVQQDRISEVCTLLLITQRECQNVRGKSLSGSIAMVTAPSDNESTASVAFRKKMHGDRCLFLFCLAGLPTGRLSIPGLRSAICRVLNIKCASLVEWSEQGGSSHAWVSECPKKKTLKFYCFIDQFSR